MKKVISLAPMVDRTDNNFRHFTRLISKNITVYTEMISDKAIINNEKRVLEIVGNQNPIVLQLATNDKNDARKAIELAQKYNYDEINLNIGCPSDRISNNQMGAYLMSDIPLVKEIIKNIKKVTNKPLTIKHRIGIDGTGVLEGNKKYIDYEYLKKFVSETHELGVNKYIVHSRIAILKGLNPKQNRTIPPLDYERVYQLKKDFPNLFIEINGGIKTIEEMKKHLEIVDGVMLGRILYDNPMIMYDIENEIFNNPIKKDKRLLLDNIVNYLDNKNKKEIHHYLMHLMGLFLGENGSSKWKQLCSNTKTNISDIKKFIGEIWN